MDYVIQPAPFSGGTVTVPGDKSISHRALMLGAIADGRTDIDGFLAAEDCLATLAALESLGVPIDRDDPATVHVDGVGMHGLTQARGPLDLGNSGTAMRLIAGLLCGQGFDSTLTGDASLAARPMQRIIDPLTSMGGSIDSENGRPPLVIHGNRSLAGIHYSLPVASAQVKSAVLFAALYARGETVVTEPAVTRDHTERLLQSMGARIQSDGGRIRIQGADRLEGTNVKVPADLSSAAFLIVGALVAKDAEVLIQNVGVNPTRTGVIKILREMGGNIGIENPQLAGEEPLADIRVRSSELRGIAVEPSLVSRAIDEFPVLFVAAALARGSTRFSGIGELRVKESDRIGTMAEGLRKLGIKLDEFEDGAEIHGAELSGGTVDSRGDHRVAMSFAVAGTVAQSTVRVRNVDAVDTSFPGFPAILGALGAELSTEGSNTA
ncbi:MAG: 3-phosphoshikimate 1-carboxyvinyltransferase [Woeseia sp.]